MPLDTLLIQVLWLLKVPVLSIHLHSRLEADLCEGYGRQYACRLSQENG